jgi:ubiquinone biosynthesis accessory factor UbiJ
MRRCRSLAGSSGFEAWIADIRATGSYTVPMSSTPDTPSIKSYLGAILEALLNQALALDPDLPNEIAAFDGRSITLTWSGPEWALGITVDKNRLRVGPANSGESDLSLRTTLGGLLGLLRPDTSKSLPAGRVQIAGDVELMRRIEQLSRRFDPDWESAFAARLGPIIGPQIARHLGEAFSWVRASAQGLSESAAEYVQEESRDVAAKHELDEFGESVERLRDDVERIEARLQRLVRQRGAK